MRKRPYAILLVLFVLLSAVCLAGCGAQQAAPKKSTALFDPAVPREDTPEAIDAELTARFQSIQKKARKKFTEEDGHKILMHKYGQTMLPDHPQRIAVVGLEDTAVSMHLPIVAAHVVSTSYLYPFMKDMDLANIHINPDTRTVNLEEVQEVHPDLILLRDSYDKNTYLALSKIAPVAPLDLQDEEVTELALAEAVGRPELGESRLLSYYATVRQARLAIKQQIGNQTVALLRVLQKEIRLYPYSANATNRFMYELLNLRPPDMVVALDANKNNMVLSMESLPDLDADYLVLSSGYGAGAAGNQEAAAKRYAALREDPLWQTLPAVRKGHLLEVNSVVWNAHGLIAKELAIEDLVNWLGHGAAADR